MALWLIRAGRHGQGEQRFLDDDRVYLQWGGIDVDLRKVGDRDQVKALLRQRMPDAKEGKITNGASQVWAFIKEMSVGDWFVLPSKMKRAIHVGEIASDLKFEVVNGESMNYRDVKWLATDIPRSNFDQDLLYSFGAFMTVCRIKRNDAEKRLKAMATADWTSTGIPKPKRSKDDEGSGEDTTPFDVETAARDDIAKLIMARFQGHGLARLVNAILEAQGYTTFVSPEGPDKGIDILAAPGPLGFGEPRICVQVKSGASPLDRPTLDQLIGAMQNVQAQQGLLVSWGGFKSSVDKEKAQQFFRVRLWDQDALIDQILEHYDKLDADLKADLPLKRLWAVADLEDAAT